MKISTGIGFRRKPLLAVLVPLELLKTESPESDDSETLLSRRRTSREGRGGVTGFFDGDEVGVFLVGDGTAGFGKPKVDRVGDLSLKRSIQRDVRSRSASVASVDDDQRERSLRSSAAAGGRSAEERRGLSGIAAPKKSSMSIGAS